MARDFEQIAAAESVLANDLIAHEAGPDNVSFLVLAAKASKGAAFVRFTVTAQEWQRMTSDDMARQFYAPAAAVIRQRLEP